MRLSSPSLKISSNISTVSLFLRVFISNHSFLKKAAKHAAYPIMKGNFSKIQKLLNTQQLQNFLSLIFYKNEGLFTGLHHLICFFV
ncbi:hypothetical protein C0966_01975 [Bacillus methanolicus]|nr:hypothetical protein [Bacillus methanolicus]